MIADTIMSGRPIAVVMMSAMIAMMFESGIVIPSRAPSVAAGGAQFLVVLGREVPCPTPITLLLCALVSSGFGLIFWGFCLPHFWGPSPLPPPPPLFVSLVASLVAVIGGVGGGAGVLGVSGSGSDLRLLHKRLAKCEQFCYN